MLALVALRSIYSIRHIGQHLERMASRMPYHHPRSGVKGKSFGFSSSDQCSLFAGLLLVGSRFLAGRHWLLANSPLSLIAILHARSACLEKVWG